MYLNKKNKKNWPKGKYQNFGFYIIPSPFSQENLKSNDCIVYTYIYSEVLRKKFIDFSG